MANFVYFEKIKNLRHKVSKKSLILQYLVKIFIIREYKASRALLHFGGGAMSDFGNFQILLILMISSEDVSADMDDMCVRGTWNRFRLAQIEHPYVCNKFWQKM